MTKADMLKTGALILYPLGLLPALYGVYLFSPLAFLDLETWQANAKDTFLVFFGLLLFGLFAPGWLLRIKRYKTALYSSIFAGVTSAALLGFIIIVLNSIH
jgi:hypothetical protein